MESGKREFITAFVALSVSVLSLFATSLVLFIFFRVKHLRENFSFRLIAFLCAADFFWEISHILSILRLFIPGIANTYLCGVQSFLIISSRLSVIAWTSAIAFSVYQNQVRGLPMSSVESRQNLLCFTSTFLPAVVAVIAVLLFKNIWFDRVNKFCWMPSLTREGNLTEDGVLFQVSFFYAPLLIGVAFNLFAYTRAINIAKQFFSHNQQLQEGFIRKMRLFPLALLVAFGPEIVHRIYSYIIEESNFWIGIVATIFSCSIGLLNTIIYGAEVFSLLRVDPCCAPIIRICYREEVVEQIPEVQQEDERRRTSSIAMIERFDSSRLSSM